MLASRGKNESRATEKTIFNSALLLRNALYRKLVRRLLDTFSSILDTERITPFDSQTTREDYHDKLEDKNELYTK